jgi:hypothetical protein
MPHRNLNVLDAADRAADAVDQLIERFPRRLLHVGQIRNAVQSVGAKHQ